MHNFSVLVNSHILPHFLFIHFNNLNLNKAYLVILSDDADKAVSCPSASLPVLLPYCVNLIRKFPQVLAYPIPTPKKGRLPMPYSFLSQGFSHSPSIFIYLGQMLPSSTFICGILHNDPCLLFPYLSLEHFWLYFVFQPSPIRKIYNGIFLLLLPLPFRRGNSLR